MVCANHIVFCSETMKSATENNSVTFRNQNYQCFPISLSHIKNFAYSWSYAVHCSIDQFQYLIFRTFCMILYKFGTVLGRLICAK